MKTKAIKILGMILLLSMAIPAVYAKGSNGQSGKSNVAHLYLFEKTGVPDWDIVEDGAWGKLKYNLAGSTFDFVFNGHGLEPLTDYTLIYYADPWPGTGSKSIVMGTSNDEGDIHLMGSPDIGDIPIAGDANAGAKIWLVLSSHITVTAGEVSFDSWDASEYLFEDALIGYDDTDP
jgi:hypothetical protein